MHYASPWRCPRGARIPSWRSDKYRSQPCRSTLYSQANHPHTKRTFGKAKFAEPTILHNLSQNFFFKKSFWIKISRSWPLSYTKSHPQKRVGRTYWPHLQDRHEDRGNFILRNAGNPKRLYGAKIHKIAIQIVTIIKTSNVMVRAHPFWSETKCQLCAKTAHGQEPKLNQRDCVSTHP